MRFRHLNNGTCSEAVSFEIEDGILRNVVFEYGCDGNTQGISRLVEGMPAEEVVKRLEGIRCGFKPTSCPDQLAKALKEALTKMG